MRRGFAPTAFRMRITSIATAEPAALSVASVPSGNPSKCPPSITTSSRRAGSVPGISAMMLYPMESVGSSRVSSITSSVTCALLSTRLTRR